MHPAALIETTSAVKAWFLSRFRGCQVQSCWRRPYIALGCFVVYKSAWVLVPATVKAVS